MKITRVKAEVIELELVKPIIVTFGVIETFKTVLIKVETDEGISGIGEASAFGPVTGETVDTVISFIKSMDRILVGQNPLEIEKINKIMDKSIIYNASAKAGIDIALHDIFAKVLDVPLYVALGGDSNTYESDKTLSIGTVEKMVSEAKEAVAEGFNIIKLKAGLDASKDVEALRCIREACGEDLIIRMDANQGWNHVEAIRAINEMEKYNLDAIEQPIAYWDIDNLRNIKEKINVPLMADESVHNEIDAMRLVKANAVDVFNIKLMKSKGIYGASRINSIAESAGIECMIGCMAESPVGITAGAHFVAAKKNVTRADLDALFAIKKCKGIEGGVVYEAGFATLPDMSGLGVTIDF